MNPLLPVAPAEILLLADTSGAALLLTSQLAASAPGEFNISVVNNLTDAQEQLQKHTFAALLLDLPQPDSSTLEIIGRIKGMAPTSPIIVMASVNNAAPTLLAEHNSALDYVLTNVVDGHMLARGLRYLLERRRTQEELHRAHEQLEQRVTERTAFLKSTNRRLHEEITERRRTEAILRKERDFSSAIFNTVGAIVVVLDAQGAIVQCNHHCEQITGYSEDEILGQCLWEVFFDAQEAMRVRSMFAGLLARESETKYENYWLNKDHRPLLIGWSSTVIADDHGAIEHVIVTGVDITEKRQTEELERQRLLGLAHISRVSTMGQMATEIAHELNQPLCAIASYSDTCLRMLKSGGTELTEVHHVLTEIGHQAERAGEVIRRIRNFVRKEAAERTTVDLNELVQDVVRLTQTEARWNQVVVHTELQPMATLVHVDKILIEQVIMNLVRNAIEAIALADSQQRRVDISTHGQAGGRLAVSVQDSGPGLPAEILDKIFQPFFTTKPQGMGMGLSLSLSIAKAHGGTLRAEPCAAGGSIFQLELPAPAKTH